MKPVYKFVSFHKTLADALLGREELYKEAERFLIPIKRIEIKIKYQFLFGFVVLVDVQFMDRLKKAREELYNQSEDGN